MSTPAGRAQAKTDANTYPPREWRRNGPEFQEAMREYRERERLTREEFKDDLAKDNFRTTIDPEVADAIFAKAWEDGHSEGYTSVQWRYEELADLAQKAFDAGYDAARAEFDVPDKVG